LNCPDVSGDLGVRAFRVFRGRKSYWRCGSNGGCFLPRKTRKARISWSLSTPAQDVQTALRGFLFVSFGFAELRFVFVRVVRGYTFTPPWQRAPSDS
jgi:hypothetical protein